MNSLNFDKFIKKMEKENLIKSLVCGFSAALLMCALLLFLAKRIPFSLHFLVLTAIFIVSGCFFSFLFKKRLFVINEKILAKRLDQDALLQERVKTMVEFKNQDSPMISLQRKDTNERLEKVDSKQLKLRLSFSNFILSIFAVIALTFALIIPEKEIIPNADTPSESDSSQSDSAEESSDSMQQDSSNGGSDGDTGQGDGEENNDSSIQDAIDNMKNEVNENEGLNQDSKDEINEDLDQLGDELQDADADEAGDQIDQTKEDINDKLDEQITKDEIGDALQNQDTTQELGENVSEGDTEGTSSSLDDLRDSLSDLSDEDLKNALQDIASDIDQALEESGVDSSDPLYQAFENLSNNLKDNAEHVNDSDIQDQIDQSFEQAKQEINDALNDQNAIEDLKDSLNQQLDDLKNQMNGGGNGDPSDTPEDPEDQSGQGGGGDGANEGSGDIKYASDDLIYDPNTGTYVKYGDVMNYYYSLVLQGLSEGDLPEDLESLINAYFSSLYFDGNN